MNRPRPSRRDFREKYASELSPAAREVERAVLGHEVGLGGYTTMEQARTLCDLVPVASGARVLDVGAGRGWPGTFLARCMGCSLVFADIPIAGLAEARRRFGAREGIATASAVAADGRRLPFGAASFVAAVHADVLC